MVINAKGIEKYFGERLIFAVDELKVYQGDKIGIVGANGAGKSTLLKVLAGVLPPDKGSVELRAKVGYVDQLDERAGAADEVNRSIFGVSFDDGDGLSEDVLIEDSAEGLTDSLASGGDAAVAQPIKSGGDTLVGQHSIKSGGEIMRKKLAAAFSDYVVLALDEPTSNLDMAGIDTLLGMLTGVETLLIISHDRNLLQQTCNKIIEVEGGKITVFSGDYAAFEQVKAERIKAQQSDFDEYQQEKRRLERAKAEAGARAGRVKKTPSRMGNSEARLHRREATAKQAKISSAASAIASRLERLEAVERPQTLSVIRPDFSLTDPPRGKHVLWCESLDFSYSAAQNKKTKPATNPANFADFATLIPNRVIFENAKLTIENGEKTAIIGDNGAGKTTLLRLIMTRPDLISRSSKTKIGYMPQKFEFDKSKSILDVVLETAVQNQTVCRGTLAQMGFRGDDVHKKTAVLSGGELIKTMLSRLIVSDCNMLVLDEPTNYLDIYSVAAVTDALKNYQGTLVFVSHDRAFIAEVASTVLEVKGKKIIQIK